MSEIIIDFHTYLGKDAYGDHSLTVDELITNMDACRINLSVVVPILDFPGPDPAVHDKLYKSWQQFPNRIIPFARLDPRYGQHAVNELVRTIDDLGFKGLLFNPSSTCSLPYHPGVLPLMQVAAQRHIPVLIPTGNSYFGLPEQAALLAEKIPELCVILGHMGTAPHALRAIKLAEEYPNLYLETSLQQSPFRIHLAMQSHSAERLLFGSSAPYSHPSPELLKVRLANINDQQKTMILGKNAIKLLGLENRWVINNDH